MLWSQGQFITFLSVIRSAFIPGVRVAVVTGKTALRLVHSGSAVLGLWYQASGWRIHQRMIDNLVVNLYTEERSYS
jgi:hypothetical protein